MPAGSLGHNKSLPHWGIGAFLQVRKDAFRTWDTVDITAKRFKASGMETASWIQISALQSNGWMTWERFLTSLSLQFQADKKKERERLLAQILEKSEASLVAGSSSQSFDLGVNSRDIIYPRNVRVIDSHGKCRGIVCMVIIWYFNSLSDFK